MKDNRKGEALWEEWDGEGYPSEETVSKNFYYTIGHVSFENDVVRRGLASALQRDGIVDSLSAGYRLVEANDPIYQWAGNVEGESFLAVCDELGETAYGDFVEEVFEITLINLQ